MNNFLVRQERKHLEHYKWMVIRSDSAENAASTYRKEHAINGCGDILVWRNANNVNGSKPERFSYEENN